MLNQCSYVVVWRSHESIVKLSDGGFNDAVPLPRPCFHYNTVSISRVLLVATREGFADTYSAEHRLVAGLPFGVVVVIMTLDILPVVRCQREYLALNSA